MGIDDIKQELQLMWANSPSHTVKALILIAWILIHICNRMYEMRVY